MSHFARAYLAVISSHQACRKILVRIARSHTTPVKHVAYCSCLSRGNSADRACRILHVSTSHCHTHPSSMSHFARAHLTVTHHQWGMVHIALAYRMVTQPMGMSHLARAHLSPTYPPIKHVAFRSCTSHGRSTNGACCILLVPMAWSRHRLGIMHIARAMLVPMARSRHQWGMLHIARAYRMVTQRTRHVAFSTCQPLTVTSSHQACGILLVPISCPSRAYLTVAPPMGHVAN